MLRCGDGLRGGVSPTVTSGQAHWRAAHEQSFVAALVVAGSANSRAPLETPAGNSFTAVYDALRRVAEDARLTRVLELRLFEIAEGLRYEEIAGKHGLSMNTIKTQARGLYRAIGVRCRHEVESAIDAAIWRSEAGATVEELYRFLRLRFE